MVLIWKMETVPLGSDPRLPHHYFPPKQLPLAKFLKDTGLRYTKLNTDDQWAMAKRLDAIKRENSLVFEDIVLLGKDINSDFDAKLKSLFEARTEPTVTARCLVEGAMYVDIYSKKCWNRMFLEQGDMVVIPAGTLHRYSTDTRSYVKMKRLFTSEGKELKDMKEEEQSSKKSPVPKPDDPPTKLSKTEDKREGSAKQDEKKVLGKDRPSSTTSSDLKDLKKENTIPKTEINPTPGKSGKAAEPPENLEKRKPLIKQN